MDHVSPHLTFGCIRQLIIYAVIFTVSEAKNCGYRVYAPDRRTHIYATRRHEPAEVGVKDCTWGCCWDQTYDVCCPFPMEIVVVGVISSIAIAIVVAVLVILLKYFLSRWRTCGGGHNSACKQGNYTTLVYPCQSTVLHQNYIQLDKESPSPQATKYLCPDSKVPISKSQEEIPMKTSKLSQLIYRTL